MKLYITFSLCAVSFTTNVLASQSVFHSIGPSNTRGQVTFLHDLSSSMTNPAAASTYLHADAKFRANALGPVGLGYEVGKIDSLVDELDELIDILDDDDLNADEALDAIDRFSPFLKNAAENGSLKGSGNLSMPLFPLILKNSWGTLTAEITASGSIRSTVLDDDINIVVVGDNYRINTRSSLYVKSAGLISLSLGYSKDLWQYEESNVYAGVKINANRYTLAKNVLALSSFEGDDDIIDVIQDDYEDNANSSIELSLDVGLLWVGQNHSVGFTVTDVNEPEFHYGTLNANCSLRTGSSVDNCFAAQEFIAQNRIAAHEVYVANAQGTVEAAMWLNGAYQWSINAAYDVNDKNDAIGDVYQWASASTSLQLDNWVVPEVRVGYRKNLKGSELGYYTLGLTLLKYAYLDVRWSDESVVIDDSTLPRSAFVNLGFQTSF